MIFQVDSFWAGWVPLFGPVSGSLEEYQSQYEGEGNDSEQCWK